PSFSTLSLHDALPILVDVSAAWILVILALVSLGLPWLLPALELPQATLAHRIALGLVLALYAGSLLRRGGRAWLGDLWPRNAHRSEEHTSELQSRFDL